MNMRDYPTLHLDT